jgi:hypothetical protein
LIILIILGEEYKCKLWSSSLCSFLKHPVTSYLLSRNIIIIIIIMFLYNLNNYGLSSGYMNWFHS